MFEHKLERCVVAAFLVSGMLLTACGDRSSKTYGADLIAKRECLQSVTIDSQINDIVKDFNYSGSDTVKYHYEVSMIGGLLTQKVTKEINAVLNKNTGEWEVLTEDLISCEVDAAKLPGSSWKADSLSEEQIKTLFGDEISSGETGTVYIRFLKKMGLFSFNLTNPKILPTSAFSIRSEQT